MKTWRPKAEEVQRKWWIVDASGKTVGRLATEISRVLRGKNKPQFTPDVDTGDFVVVINTDGLKFTGNKLTEKNYYSHSRFFGLKELSADKQHAKDSTEIIRSAVRGMLPKNKLASQQIKKLKTYTGATHPHEAQKPEALSL